MAAVNPDPTAAQVGLPLAGACPTPRRKDRRLAGVY
jgi:hypothetical protein